MTLLEHNSPPSGATHEAGAPTVSIIICTRNRAEDLAPTLSSIAASEQTLPAELLIVDNGSTDATREVVRAFVCPHLPMRYIFEPRNGQNVAYNTAVAAAHGKVLLFTDDDIRVPKNWIAGMCMPILKSEVDAVAGGIRIAPHLLRPWMTPFLRMMFAETTRLDAKSPGDFIGANMAIARHVFDKVPAFDENLGPGCLGVWGETLFARQMCAAGCTIGGALDIEVEHHFEPARLRRSAMLRQAIQHGESHAYVLHHWEHQKFRGARLGAMLRSLRTGRQRLMQMLHRGPDEGCTDQEFLWTRSAAMYRYLARESRQPWNYDLQGLVSRRTPTPAPALSGIESALLEPEVFTEVSGSHPPVVSIIISTHNRAEELRKTLASIVETDVPAHLPTELLVLDNASTDHTRETVASFAPAHMTIRYLREPRRGKGYAINSAIATARGKVLLFTDDDVRVPKDWIAGVCGPIAEGRADAVAGGVRIAPHLVRSWMSPLLRMMYAETGRLDPVSPTDMIGANMAVGRQVFEKVPLFDVNLGTGALGAWEETLFSYQLREAGFVIGAVLETTVEHHFHESRLRRESLLEQAMRHGRSHGYVRYHWEHRDLNGARIGGSLRTMRVAAQNIMHRFTGGSEEGCTDREFLSVRSAAMHKFIAEESGRPRHYERHGLVYRDGKVPAADPLEVS